MSNAPTHSVHSAIATGPLLLLLIMLSLRLLKMVILLQVSDNISRSIRTLDLKTCNLTISSRLRHDDAVTRSWRNEMR